jgi:hypothetical protein
MRLSVVRVVDEMHKQGKRCIGWAGRTSRRRTSIR